MRSAVLALFLLIASAGSAGAVEGMFICEHADECEDENGPVEVAWQSPPPADVPCTDELFSSAIGICEGTVVDEPVVPKPPLSCDGVSCFPNDVPVAPASPAFSYSHPIALAALWRTPKMAGETLPRPTQGSLDDGFPRRLERPPRVSV